MAVSPAVAVASDPGLVPGALVLSRGIGDVVLSPGLSWGRLHACLGLGDEIGRPGADTVTQTHYTLALR